mmetsp:Transcript_6638/g.7636  ORF Transcript_6638/g.7636 Transcript_6638/m.7636 type:complete len:80 (-) Transcript_6638:134-373(-)
MGISNCQSASSMKHRLRHDSNSSHSVRRKVLDKKFSSSKERHQVWAAMALKTFHTHSTVPGALIPQKKVAFLLCECFCR